MCLAIPGQVQSVEAGGHLATVDVMGVRRQVNVDLLDDEPVAPGEWILIHVGFAMSRISAEHAREQLEMLAVLGEHDEAREEAEGYSFGHSGGAS